MGMLFQNFVFEVENPPPRMKRRGIASDLDPGPVTLGGVDAGGDEGHALQPVRNGRIKHGRIDLLALALGLNGPCASE